MSAIPILTYHSWVIESDQYQGNDHIALASDLRTISRLGLRIVRLDQVVDAYLCNRLDDFRGCIAITFDDGACLDHLPVTLSSGAVVPSMQQILLDSPLPGLLHATSFVIASSRVDPGTKVRGEPAASWWNNQWWQSAAMDGYLKIESHGWLHSARDINDQESANAQILTAANAIDGMLGRGYCRYFAYPFGTKNEFLAQDYFPRSIESHRTRAAFTTEPEPLHQGCERWALPRFVCGRDWKSAEEFAQMLKAIFGETRRRNRSNTPSAPPIAPQAGVSNSTEHYREAWNRRAHDRQAALLAVDGSASEDIVRLTGAFSARQVSTALDLQQSDAVLELGCGVGRIGNEIAPKCARWVGCDISSNMIDVARQRLNSHDNVDFMQLQRTSLHGLETDSFDKAYCVAVFCHMDKEDMFLYLQELARVVKPGGCVYFETWNLAHPVGWKRWGYEVRHWAHSRQQERKDVARNQFSVPQEVELMTRHAGFEIASCYTDSAWVQMVAVTTGLPERLEDMKDYCNAHASAIANEPLWSECFARSMEVLYGEITPDAALKWLEDQPEGETTALYRNYLLALWKRNEKRWGPAPDGYSDALS